MSNNFTYVKQKMHIKDRKMICGGKATVEIGVRQHPLGANKKRGERSRLATGRGYHP
jgi:hypothetical protein